MANKNSLYIGALTSFILDTKPFHSKLTEVQEIYQFSDSMTVKFDERLFSSTMMKAAWTYPYFSGGIAEISPGLGQVLPLHELVSPLVRGYTVNDDPSNTRGTFKAFRDENTDLTSQVPFAFDPTSIQGIGLSDAFVQRNGNAQFNEPLLEGHDFHLSHGAYIFQIKQTVSSQPLVVGTFNDVYEVTDGPFPIIVTLPFTTADSLIIVAPGGNAVQLTLDTISITGPGEVTVFGLSADPNYKPLFTTSPNQDIMALAIAAAQITDPGLTTDLTNGTFVYRETGSPDDPDGNVREDGSWHFHEQVFDELLIVNSISVNPIRDVYEEFILEATSESTLAIYGTASGLIGSVTVGASFNSVDIAFDTAFFNKIISASSLMVGKPYEIMEVGDTDFTAIGAASNTAGEIFVAQSTAFGTGTVAEVLTIGNTYTLSPSAKVSVHHAAPLEKWSLINVNPHPYSRPIVTTNRYGYLQSLSGQRGYVTIIDEGIASSTITLTCINANQFLLTSSSEPWYTATVNVGTTFTGRIGFKIIQGTVYTFTPGDKFFIEIENKPPMAADLDIYYGYDLAPYDEDQMVYNTISNALANYREKIGFGFDSRFAAFDVSALGLTLAANVVNGRQWRFRAVPNLSAPLNLHNVQGGYPINQVNELASLDPLNPDAVGQYDMPNSVTSEGATSGTDPDTLPDALLYYASQFDVEFFDGGAWNSIGTASIGVPFSSATHGLSFTIAQVPKPYIAGTVTHSYFNGSSVVSETVTGGDTISFTVQNEVPTQTEFSGITSRRTPRLIIYGEGFHDVAPARWTMAFTSGGTYLLQGIYSTGANAGSTVFDGSGVLVNISTEGHSYRNEDVNLHFTLVKGAVGLAAGDVISFETFSDEPSFLVHGSVSGWQPDAQIGKWYWNGKIGFKIPKASAQLFSTPAEEFNTGSPWITSIGPVFLNHLRTDAPTAVYTITSHTTSHWTLYRDGAVVADGEFELKDRYVHLTMPTAVVGTSFRMHVVGHTYTLAEGHDLAIVRASAGRMPTADDFVLLERNRSDSIQISIKANTPEHQLILNELAPVVTDLRFVDHNANSGIPLSNTSPETAVTQGWLGVLETRLDKGLSVAEFSDPATSVVVRAAATGETIGVVESLGPTKSEPVVFRWDVAFHEKYLPLNTEATVVTLGSGLDDRVSVNMRDTLFLLVSGGLEPENAMFSDVFTTNISEENRFLLRNSYSDAFGAALSDIGFTGFLPGYDNTAYDFETGTGDINLDETWAGNSQTNLAAALGYYDAGVPLTDYFLQAQSLALLGSRTVAQDLLLEQLIEVLGPYISLTADSIITTTMTEFIESVGGNPPVLPQYNNTLNWTPVKTGFGVPDVGLGIAVEQNQAASVSTSVAENITITSPDAGTAFNLREFNIGVLDGLGATTVFLYQAAPASSGTPVPSGLYANYETPLIAQAQIVQLSFKDPVATPPSVYIWFSTDPAMRLVSVLERVTDRTFRFSVPSAVQFKLFCKA